MKTCRQQASKFVDANDSKAFKASMIVLFINRIKNRRGIPWRRKTRKLFARLTRQTGEKLSSVWSIKRIG
jgi:hypothetical protein